MLFFCLLAAANASVEFQKRSLKDSRDNLSRSHLKKLFQVNKEGVDMLVEEAGLDDIIDVRFGYNIYDVETKEMLDSQKRFELFSRCISTDNSECVLKILKRGFGILSDYQVAEENAAIQSSDVDSFLYVERREATHPLHYRYKLRNDENALRVAIKSKAYESFKLLIEAGWDYSLALDLDVPSDFTPIIHQMALLSSMIVSSEDRPLEFILADGEDHQPGNSIPFVDEPIVDFIVFSEKSCMGMNALICSVALNKLEMFKSLLRYSADPLLITDKYGSVMEYLFTLGDSEKVASYLEALIDIGKLNMKFEIDLGTLNNVIARNNDALMRAVLKLKGLPLVSYKWNIVLAYLSAHKQSLSRIRNPSLLEENLLDFMVPIVANCMNRGFPCFDTLFGLFENLRNWDKNTLRQILSFYVDNALFLQDDNLFRKMVLDLQNYCQKEIILAVRRSHLQAEEKEELHEKWKSQMSNQRSDLLLALSS